MSLFGGKEIIKVASTVYNMAGDELERPNYLKSLVLRNILSGTKDTIAETLQVGYLKGPSIKLRSYFRWAQRQYTVVGMPVGNMNATGEIDPNLVAGQIAVPAGKQAWVQSVTSGGSDIGMFAERHILANYPWMIDTDWTVDYDYFNQRIEITFYTGDKVYIQPAIYSQGGTYIYAYYNEILPDVAGPVTVGNSTEIGADPFPSTTGWIFGGTGTELRTRNLSKTTTTTTVFSNGAPDRTTTNVEARQEQHNQITTFYYQDEYLGIDENDVMRIARTYMVLVESKKIASKEAENFVTTGNENGVPCTYYTTVYDQELVTNRSYHYDTQTIERKAWGPLRMFIYRLGSGNAVLDAMLSDSLSYGQFFPFMPVRLTNVNLNPDDFPGFYEQVKKSYRKAFGESLDKLLDQIDENEDVDKIDHAYIAFGVSLNVLEQACRKYLWRFFSSLMTDQQGGEEVYQTWAAKERAYASAYERWLDWKTGQRDSDMNGFGDVEPPLPDRPAIPTNILTIASPNVDVRFDQRIQWTYIRQNSGTGLAKPGAKKGEFWFQYTWHDEFAPAIYPGIDGENETTEFSSKNIDAITLFHQIDETRWESLIIVGLIHNNYIHGGKSVEILAREAIQDQEESGFIVPLHYDTFRGMSLKDSSQMATACCFIVFNSYEIYKQRWYETGFFRIIVVVAIAIVSVTLTGGAGFGLLGTHLGIGTALGFSGMTAAIVGSIANALAALVLSTLLDKALANLFDNPILGMIVSMAAGLFSSGLASINSGGLSINWGSLMRADNLLKLTNSLGKGYIGYVQGNIQGMQEDLQALMEDAEKQRDLIHQASLEAFGFGDGLIDPMMFTSLGDFHPESRDTFLTRTLMTGSEVAAMSNDMLTDFAELTLQLPDAFTA